MTIKNLILREKLYCKNLLFMFFQFYHILFPFLGRISLAKEQNRSKVENDNNKGACSREWQLVLCVLSIILSNGDNSLDLFLLKSLKRINGV